MKNCQNQWHIKKDCKDTSRCETCGIHTCSPNFPYHVCIASLKRRNSRRKWTYDKTSVLNKCKECGCTHKNSGGTGKIGDTCFNCEVLLQSFHACIEALNRSTPIMGKPRRIKILSYEIEIERENE